jgi:hypothetical protein
MIGSVVRLIVCNMLSPIKMRNSIIKENSLEKEALRRAKA